jgi:3-oxoacyl-[acyl-carrier-protein] synthase-1
MTNSGLAAAVAGHFGIGGRVTNISAACATGLYNIGHAFELIRWGYLDVCLCGGVEVDVWEYVGASADNVQGVPTSFNDRPHEACRPFDRDREGLILSAGAGILVLESFEHAQRRQARMYAELAGYGVSNDGRDMFVPSGEGLQLAAEGALKTAAEVGVSEIDYVNPHGAGTVTGDPVEVRIIRDLLGERPYVSSTKGISGHAVGAAAAHETIYTTLMMEHGFIAPSYNLVNIAPDCQGVRHVQKLLEEPIRTAMVFNSGLGGTNVCAVLQKL